MSDKIRELLIDIGAVIGTILFGLFTIAALLSIGVIYWLMTLIAYKTTHNIYATALFMGGVAATLFFVLKKSRQRYTGN